MIHKETQNGEALADIAIIGAGPSGLAFAAVCERQGLDYVLYEREAKNTAPRGGSLDLHIGSGQLAMKEAGVFAEFKKNSRAGDATIHKVYDKDMNFSLSWGEGRDSPEIDRPEIKSTLLTGITDENIHWRKGLESAERDESGQIVLKFIDGTTASGFKLVVGADGALSKIRPLVTSVNPKYWGGLFLTATITKTNQFFPTLDKRAGEGPLVVLGRETVIWCQMQGTGEYRVEWGVYGPEDFVQRRLTNVNDTDEVKRLLLTDEFFGQHDQFVKDMLNAMDGPFHHWPLWEMPPDSLNWEPQSDVCLIGDSAHVTTPFIGDGANCAMRDSVLLAKALKQHGIGKEAIADYEKQMFSFAIPMITNSNWSGRMFFEQDAPRALAEVMAATPFVGATDEI